MKVAKKTRAIIAKTTETYKPVAERGRDIYFVIA
jgi:hypothetical protein